MSGARIVAKNKPGRSEAIADHRAARCLFKTLQLTRGPFKGVEIARGNEGGDILAAVAVQVRDYEALH
jgi:hypothetical protein